MANLFARISREKKFKKFNDAKPSKLDTTLILTNQTVQYI